MVLSTAEGARSLDSKSPSQMENLPTPSSRHSFVERKTVRLSECVVPLLVLRHTVTPRFVFCIRVGRESQHSQVLQAHDQAFQSVCESELLGSQEKREVPRPRGCFAVCGEGLGICGV